LVLGVLNLLSPLSFLWRPPFFLNPSLRVSFTPRHPLLSSGRKRPCAFELYRPGPLCPPKRHLPFREKERTSMVYCRSIPPPPIILSMESLGTPIRSESMAVPLPALRFSLCGPTQKSFLCPPPDFLPVFKVKFYLAGPRRVPSKLCFFSDPAFSTQLAYTGSGPSRR